MENQVMGAIKLNVVLLNFTLIFCFHAASAQASIDSMNNTRNNKLEFSLGYRQFKYGYFSTRLSHYHENKWSPYKTNFSENLEFGYSPWSNSVNLEFNERFNIYLWGIGLTLGRVQGINTRGNWFIEPEVILNLVYIRFAYSYSFLLNNDFPDYIGGSKLSIEIPILHLKWYEKKAQTKFGPAIRYR